MTNITFHKKNGKICRFEIVGHTGKDEFGKDVLCAGISSVAQSAVLGITEVLKLSPFVEISDAYLAFTMKEKDIENVPAQVLLVTCLKSLKEIVKNEKKFVKLEEKNDD